MFRLVPLGRLLSLGLLTALTVGFALLDATQAQPDKGRKHALLVGVRKYDSDKFEDLRFTENDVEELSSVLRESAHFSSVRVLATSRGIKERVHAPTAANVRQAIRELLARKTKDDTILVALSGHGIQSKVKEGGKERDESFFCPADAQMNDNDTLVSLGKLVQDLDDCGARVKLLLVDACRNDPKMGRNVDVETLPRLPRGTAALFSCSSGERAFETDKLGSGHGVFFHHVIEGLKGDAKNRRGEVTWSRLSEYVTESVSRQVPKLIGSGAQQTPELKVNLRGESSVLVGPVSENEVVNSVGMKLVRIPAGKLMMGSTKGEQDAVIADYEKAIGKKMSEDDLAWLRSEGPRHPVEITRAFFLAVHEVTQGQFKAVMGYNPSVFSADATGRPGVKYTGSQPGARKAKVLRMSTDDFPVDNVSWHEAVELCRKLSALPAERRAGRTYRLPSEAEWEYACRGQPPLWAAPARWGPTPATASACTTCTATWRSGAATGTTRTTTVTA
jgi:formylglycine-generating enzyme required for sulfatase activity